MFSLTDELKREREFYRSRGEVCPKDLPQAQDEEMPQQDDKAINDTDYHRLDEQVSDPKLRVCYKKAIGPSEEYFYKM